MAHQAMSRFLNEIPLDRLTGFPTVPKTIWFNKDLRLDMQGMTNKGLHNLQVQINDGTEDNALRSVVARVGRISLAVVHAPTMADRQAVGRAIQMSFDGNPEERRGWANGVLQIVA
ncbi:hypothetical protein BGX28_000610 [Mortierella sp. GBA30]|nr:hypothetical protein BGX28_000610 [Mortierella sp. GBA30]